VITEPPLFDGAVHDRLTWVGDIAVAVNPVGVPGAVSADDEVGCTTTSFDGEVPVPNWVIA
jgi:hypothetical protein